MQFTAMINRVCRATTTGILMWKNRIVINRQLTINRIRIRITKKNSTAAPILTSYRTDLTAFVFITQIFKPAANHRHRVYRMIRLYKRRKITTIYSCHRIFRYNLCPALIFCRNYNYIVIRHYIEMQCKRTVL